MTNATPTLFAVGDNCLDVYLTKGFVTVGGNALNVAAQWQRNGADARYFGAVGADQEAALMLDVISSAGLNAGDVEVLPGDTAVTLLADDAGERRFLLESLGAGENYVPDQQRYDDLLSADWVHLGTHSSDVLVRRLVLDRVPFSLDVSTRPFAISLADVPLVFASGPDDASVAVEPLIDGLKEAGARKVVVTCGKRGSFYDDGVSRFSAGSVPVSVVDTCGAGDSFIAAFITALTFNGFSEAEALNHAAWRASETCTHLGGFPQEIQPVPGWLLEKYDTVIRAAQRV
ncbi:fructoselysine 6-kinase [Rhizobium sp. CG5]|uniref:PfkB family carbohydrate kinase n=1 Tax=Rhizobium sp. CG5 TaxID=2726076 RepID=UPI0020337F35|nr:PfkB family carbohydrate kinase [Rhizobium sp. CG5]MCM2474454.1 fructoselysine 6-kinase [Rhizobium sp. CG5]